MLICRDILGVGGGITFPHDQEQGKGAALLCFFHTIQERDKEVSRNKAYTDHRGRSKTIFICRQKKKKKKLGGSTVKFSCFVGSKLMYKNRPYFYIIGSELLKTEIKKCHSYENRR